jgi:outer membrane immunogenic protein
MKTGLLIGTAIAALVGGSAFAADIPLKAPGVAPFTWAGCYGGINGGGIGGHDHFTTTPGGTYLTPAGGAAPPNAAGTGLLAGDITRSTHDHTSDHWGWTAGVQVGCNAQSTPNFVAGVEADFNWANLKNEVLDVFGQVTSANPAFALGPEAVAIQSKIDWFSTFRLRAGFAFDRVWLYGTGGLAVADVKTATAVAFGFPTGGFTPVLGGAVHAGADTQTRVGFAAGGGMEYAFTNNWSLKAEYLYIDLGRGSHVAPLIAPGGVAAGYSFINNDRLHENVVRAGLNYRFW